MIPEMADIAIRRCTADDETGVVSLLDTVFDGWPKFDLPVNNVDHWCWKYRDNRFSPFYAFVAEAGGQIVGFSGGISHSVKVGDAVVDGGIGCDVAVHPDFRSRGVWSKIIDVFNEEASRKERNFLHYMTGNPIVIKRMSKMRPKLPHSLSNMVRIRDIDAQLKAIPDESEWIKKIGFKIVKSVNALSGIKRKYPHRESEFDVRTVKHFDSRVNLLWEKVSPSYNFIGKRDEDYLNWRYSDPRAGDFKITIAEDAASEVQGYVVSRVNRYLKDYPVGFVMDLVAAPRRLDVADSLVNQAMNSFDDEGVNIVNYLNVSRHPYNSLMARYGFVNSMVKFNVFYNAPNLATEFEALRKAVPSSIFFSWGDHDSLPLGTKKIM
jgi:GNAT superfamily N-acetyltransferase